MDKSFDIPDSTDWLDTPLTLVAPLESALRCQVCKDFFDNPVITSCSHTFCSLCIRRCLSTEGKCPACRSSDQELKLRRNWAVQELVDSFKNARPGILELARNASAARTAEDNESERPIAKKRKLEQPEQDEAVPQDDAQSQGRQTRSRSRRTESQPPTAAVEVIEDSGDEEFVPDDGLVACPICNRRMKNEAVFPHLDKCTGPQEVRKPTPSLGSLQPLNQVLRDNSSVKRPERLPHLNYSILKEGVLRKKLRDMGIPDWGPKPLLQKRHTEWMNLWNSNCDSKLPKSKRELLRELDIWERTQGGQAPASSAAGTNSIMRKDFDAAAWSSNHDDDFKRLIANARKRSDAIVRTTIPQASAIQQHHQDPSLSEATEPIPQVIDAGNPSPVEDPIEISSRGAPEGNAHSEQDSSQNPILGTPAG
ncbi:postreplication repair E3 ubiquitin-protein ligase rad18 [Paecilomyces variotii No. 5]|uniref:Postreplication repair E3 ubiquitin-protein ligase RAD18 n=1 Tax=Byssochlamys spectabilis (strain No. 5 / NBRC 109023) TaxID=1356009 RepID=V5HR72_BYSSN|nr:postreplication repair E3 ubiquitin-protein ligase rad18 [Paecilomyces variotii No. 5]